MGDKDPKLAEATKIVGELLAEGFSPIVFCRYISTAHYVAEALGKKLRGTTVVSVTGEHPPEERERRVNELAEASKRVLVATDCLSEGINLQHAFDAVVHYDLAWNPTRHEQREGRIDRYGQARPQVKTVLLFGQDNRVDGVVLEVLLKKAENIRKVLGVSVPVPSNTDRVLEAIFDRLFERGATDFRQLELFVSEQEKQLSQAWEAAGRREQRTRTIFAQHALRPDEVAQELEQSVSAIGGAGDVRRFLDEAVARLALRPARGPGGTLEIDLTRLPSRVRSRLDAGGDILRVGFEPSQPQGVTYIGRTHPLVEALSSYLLDTAIDLPAEAAAKRAGAIRTRSVDERTVLLLLRGRYLIREPWAGAPRELLAEEALVTGFRGDYEAPEWLSTEEATRLCAEAEPVANVAPAQATLWLRGVNEALPSLQTVLDDLGRRRAEELLAAHRRVRSAAHQTGRPSVEPKLPLDVIGTYVLMPAPMGGR